MVSIPAPGWAVSFHRAPLLGKGGGCLAASCWRVFAKLHVGDELSHPLTSLF